MTVPEREAANEPSRAVLPSTDGSRFNAVD
jgi:hypothetical protein